MTFEILRFPHSRSHRCVGRLSNLAPVPLLGGKDTSAFDSLQHASPSKYLCSTTRCIRMDTEPDHTGIGTFTRNHAACPRPASGRPVRRAMWLPLAPRLAASRWCVAPALGIQDVRKQARAIASTRSQAPGRILPAPGGATRLCGSAGLYRILRGRQYSMRTSETISALHFFVYTMYAAGPIRRWRAVE